MKVSAMNDVLLSPLRLSELETLIENSVRRALSQLPFNTTVATDEVLNIAQAADFLNLTTQTIYGLVSARKIPFSKPTNSRLYFSRLDLIEWLKSNRTCTVQEQTQQYNDNSLRQLRRGGRRA